MKINFIYRFASSDSKKNVRPHYFNKRNCLISFINAYKHLSDQYTGELHFINDGEVEISIIELMKEVATHIETLPNVGNSSSLRYAHQLTVDSSWGDSDIVYFAEDDYLYRKEAFKKLIHAAIDIPEAGYFSLYDHPDRYTRTDDVNKGLSNIYISRDCHWRTIESTCQSYGVRIEDFLKDRWIHKLGTSTKIPKGREIFRAVQGIGKYFWKFPKHKVVSPLPSYATHMESIFLARNVDWENLNEKI